MKTYEELREMIGQTVTIKYIKTGNQREGIIADVIDDAPEGYEGVYSIILETLNDVKGTVKWNWLFSDDIEIADVIDTDKKETEWDYQGMDKTMRDTVK